jgi:hypothetical protein
MKNPPNNRRKIKYVDKDIQGYLMTLLITLELLMVIIAILYLHQSFNQIFDATIFKTHPNKEQPLYISLLIEMFWVVAVMSSINFIALFIAHKLWVRHINKIIVFLTKTMNCTKQLSLQFPTSAQVPHHDLTTQIKCWQTHEIKRATKINNLIQQMPEHLDDIKKEELLTLTAELEQNLKFATLL